MKRLLIALTLALMFAACGTAVATYAETATVSTQKQLNKALTTEGIDKIVIFTSKTRTFVLPEIDCRDINLVVKAKRSTISNAGSFGKIYVYYAAAFNEQGSDNSFVINDSKLSLNVAEHADVSKITVSKPSELTISGESANKIAVTVKSSAANSQISTSVPLKVYAYSNSALTVLEGAEKSSVKLKKENITADIVNNSEANITLTDYNGSKTTIGPEEDTPVYNNPSEEPDNVTEQPADEQVTESAQSEDTAAISESQNAKENTALQTKLDPLGREVPYDTDLSYFEVDRPGDLVTVLEYYRTVYDGEATVVLTENSRFDHDTVWNETTGKIEGEYSRIWISNNTHLIIQSGKHMTCVDSSICISDYSSLSGDITYAEQNCIVIMNGKLDIEGVEVDAKLIAPSPRGSGDDGVWFTINVGDGIRDDTTWRMLNVGYICECNFTGPQDKVNAFMESCRYREHSLSGIYLRRDERGTGKLFVNGVEQTDLKILEHKPR